MVRNKHFFGKGLRSLLIGFSVILLTLKPSFAQVFPVQANINVAPPYSVYLSHYTSPEQQKVLVSILLRDPVIPSIDVKFRFTIEGAGIKLTTNPGWNPQPYTLNGGLLVNLEQEIIADYLKPQHLLTEGVNPQEFFRSGKLPEGYYQFKVEVIEYRRNIVISNVGRAAILLSLNEAPHFTSPFDGQKLKATNQQMFNFNWSACGTSSPLSNLNTQYEFTLVEMVDKKIDPYVAITTASNATKFVRVTDQNSLLYGPGDMPLTPGKTYAIRVKAFNTEGYELYKNNGYSQVQTFTFGDACVTPLSLTLKNPKQSQFDIDVITDLSNIAWQARFREVGTGANAGADLQSVPNAMSWSTLNPEPGATSKTLKGLRANTEYEVQVKGLCGDIASDYTPSQTITTSPMTDANRSCSSNPTPFVIDQAGPLGNLKVNDVFLAALFPVKVKEIKKQGGGKFSGRGFATLPLFNTGLAVTFDDISINSMMQLTAGEVKVVRDRLNITLFGETETTTTTGGGTTGGGTTGNPNDTTSYPPITVTVTIPSVYDSLVVTNNGTVIIYPPNGGAPVTVDLGGTGSTLLVPSDGNMDNAKIVYDGAAHPYTPGQGGATTSDPVNFTGLFARFKANSQQKYGFDTLNPKYVSITNYYKQLTFGGKQYNLPWKALKEGTPEPVNLFIKQGTDKMPFSNLKVDQTGKGTLTPIVGAGTGVQTYNITGSYKGAEESVVAFYTLDGQEQNAGAIYLATYGEKNFKVYLVPLNGATVDAGAAAQLQQGLNTIYSQAVVKWSVEPINGMPNVELGENGLDWADKALLSSYNAEMNSVISEFKTWKTDADRDAYYLFIVPKFSEGSVEGFMPRNRSFGFITKEQIVDRTVAHELGHGVFNLKHTFSDWAITQGTTNNLMDYAQGTKLWKPQWDNIHDPEFTTGLWDSMEDGASMSSANLSCIADNSTYLGKVFLDPSGKAIDIGTATPYAFFNASEKVDSLIGRLAAFKLNDKVYKAYHNKNGFAGYYAPSENPLDKIYVKRTTLSASKVTINGTVVTIKNGGKEEINTQLSVCKCEGFSSNKGDLKEYGQKFYNYTISKVTNKDAQDELYKIAVLADELGKSYFEGFVSGKKWDNNPASSNSYFAWYFNVSNVQDYSSSSLSSIVKQLESYKVALETFKLKSENNTITKDEILKIVNERFVFGADFKYLFKAPFQELSTKQRLNIIKKLVEGWVTGRSNVGSSWQEEDIILELFNTSKPEQHKEILDGIYKNKLLFGLVHGVDGDNYYKLIETIVGWVIKEYPYPQKIDVKTLIEDKKYLQFNDNFFGKSNSEDIQKIGDVSLGVMSWSGKVEYGIQANPYSYILVKFKNNLKIGESSFAAADTTYKLPALYVYMLFCKDTREKWTKIGKTGVDITLLALGAGEIKAAVELGSWGKAAIGVVDMGIGFGDIGVNNIFEKEVKSEYPTFYEKWQKISLVWGIGRLTQVGIEALVRDAYNECKALRAAEKLSEESKNAVLAVERKLESEFGEIIVKEIDKVIIPTGLITKLGNQINDFQSILTKYTDDIGGELSKILDDVDKLIDNKSIITIVDDVGQEKIILQITRGDKSNAVVAIQKSASNHPTYKGKYFATKYEPTYKVDANTDIEVDLSKNMLAPDFTTKGGKYLYPKDALLDGQKNIVQITMTGNTTKDFKEANILAGFQDFGGDAPDLNGVQYTWHHLDDYNPVTGKCTMQLVKQSAHTRVEGMGHSGAAAQYRAYNGSGY